MGATLLDTQFGRAGVRGQALAPGERGGDAAERLRAGLATRGSCSMRFWKS